MKLYASRVSHNPYIETDRIEIEERRFVIDGYSVGDRLLEGIKFEVSFNENDEVIKVDVPKEDMPYFEDLNTKKWLEATKKYADLILKDGDEVDIPKDLKDKYYINGRNIAFIE